MTQYVPMAGKRFWFVLVDEADQMTDKAQLALLSKLDSTGRIDGCVFVFTCNSTDRLEARFLSRCLTIEFSSYGMAGDIAEYLGRYGTPRAGTGTGRTSRGWPRNAAITSAIVSDAWNWS